MPGREVLALVRKGYTNAEIAEELHVQYQTVKNQIHRILRKLEVRNRTQAALVPEENEGE